MRTILILGIALVTAGIWGAVCVLFGAPTLITGLGAVVIGMIAMTQIPAPK